MPIDPHSTSLRSRRLALLGVAIASFLGCIDFTIVNTAIPAIQQAFGAQVSQSRWIVTAFVMALSSFMVAAGRLADLHGRRRVMYIGMGVFAAGSLGAGLAGQMQTLVAWRVVQGLACAVLYTASTAIVSHAFPPQERGRAIGLLFSANGIGLAIGPVAGGLLVGAVGWRWVFLVNVPLIVLSLALCRGHVQESRAQTEEGEGLDLPGLLLLMTSLPLCLLAIGFGQEWGWVSMRTLGTALAGVLLLALLVRVERHSRFPLVRFDLFTRKPFVMASLASAALAFFYCAAFFLMPLFLQQVRGAGDTAIGWLLLPTTAVMALVSPWAGRWVDRVGTRIPLLCGFLALGLSALLQTRFDAGPGWSLEMAAFVLMGIGWGLILGPSTVAALAAVPAQLSGVATGAAWTLHNFGGALGLTIATVVFGWGAGANGAAPDAPAFLAGYRVAMFVLVAVCIAMLVLLGITRTETAQPSAMDVEIR